MDLPVLFTVAEAAVVLRIGRTTAYELARRDLATDGGEGLGAVRVGGQLRIPRASLERMTGGPFETPGSAGRAAEAGAVVVPPVQSGTVGAGPTEAREVASSERPRPVRRRRSADVAAPTLPFPS